MFQLFKNIHRLAFILLVLVSEFAPWHAKKRSGQKLAAALQRLGPTFIKLGQLLSTRSDLIGDEMAEDLSRLRDRLPPFPTSIARATIEAELGAPISTFFSRFDDIPVAAASIAQVHKATTLHGEYVAIKILRPRIAEAFARDINLLFWLADTWGKRPKFRRYKAPELVNVFKESVFLELDLRFEAAAAQELAENLKQHAPGFRVPAIYWSLTTQRVLTTEWIDGIPINDVAAIVASGINPDDVLAKAAASLFSQVFKDGFFHADLHPGNLFVDKNGDVVAVDFGIMGRLDMNSRIYIAEILRGFIEQDYRHVAEVHFTAGYVPAHKSLELFTQACMAVGKPIADKPLNEISVAALLGQMFKIAAEFEMEAQPQLLLLQKTMMVTEGVGRMLNPNLNMWKLAEPMITQWAGEQFGLTGKIKHAAKHASDVARKFYPMLGMIENAAKTLGAPGGIKLHPDSIAAFNQARYKNTGKWLTFGWAALIAAIVLLTL